MMGWLASLLDLFRRPPAPVPKPTPPPIPGAGLSPTESELIAGINGYRVANGRKPLAPEPALMAVARRRAASVAALGRLDHSGVIDAIEAVHPDSPAAENLAMGQPTPSAVVDAWFNERPDPLTGRRWHREIILGSYDIIGVGVARGAGGRLFWAADFDFV